MAGRSDVDRHVGIWHGGKSNPILCLESAMCVCVGGWMGAQIVRKMQGHSCKTH